MTFTEFIERMEVLRVTFPDLQALDAAGVVMSFYDREIQVAELAKREDTASTLAKALAGSTGKPSWMP